MLSLEITLLAWVYLLSQLLQYLLTAELNIQPSETLPEVFFLTSKQEPGQYTGILTLVLLRFNSETRLTKALAMK